ncbi:hypothetical protein ACIBU0_05110 [Streptomyces sp. NPDC049627]|uniref:hypothetical protein n=1 Tax=Streptomyces sp. NPDC049627 TaxID=3365595 RepID=UPI0037963899
MTTTPHDTTFLQVGLPDVHGRLTGRRLLVNSDQQAPAPSFTARDYVLATDIDLTEAEPETETEGLHWYTGDGDIVVRAAEDSRVYDLGDAGRLVLADAHDSAGRPIHAAPRQVLKAVLADAARLGLQPAIGTEVEFYAYGQSPQALRDDTFRDPRPHSPYIPDTLLETPPGDRALLEAICRACGQAGLDVEGYANEGAPGQFEINFGYGDFLQVCDAHAVYKTIVRETARLHDRTVTFMAKPTDDSFGSSCHMHLSLGHEGGNAFHDEKVLRSFMAGVLTLLPESSLFYAPYVNSYKRLPAGASAARLAWHRRRRSTLRLISPEHNPRLELRIAGADANPYLAAAAFLAAGLYGVEQRLDCPQEGEALDTFPSTLAQAIARTRSGTALRGVLPAGAVELVTAVAQVELDEFERTVTSFERERLLERI